MAQEDAIQKLVKEAQNGDSNAYGELYDIFSQRLFNFLVGKTRHKELTEDLLHTVFLKAWSNLNSYIPGTAKFSTWLFQIANYTLIDYWRTKKDTIEIEKIDNLTQFASQIEQKDENRFVWEAIDKLPEQQRSILLLRFKEDFTITEISQILKKSQVAVRVQQHRALSALKKHLKKGGYL